MKKFLSILCMLLAIATSTFAAGYSNLLNDEYSVEGYKIKAFYDFQTNTPEVLPTTGDLRYRDGNIWGLHNFGSGSRSASVAIPVDETDLIILQTYNGDGSINVASETSSVSTENNTIKAFIANSTSETITISCARYGGFVSCVVLERDNTVATANYTVNYVYDGNVIKTVSSTGAVGSEGVVSKDPIINEENNAKYVYVSDNSESNKIAANGNTVITVTLSKVEKYNYSIYDSFGTLIVEGSAFNGDNASCAVSRYVNHEGTLYETAKSSDWYHPSFTVTPENYQFTVDYNATDINNVVFYIEGEELPGAVSGGGNSSRTSKGLTGYGQDLPVTTLPAGQYIFKIHAANGNSSARAVQIKAGDDVIAELTIAATNNNQDITTTAITLTATSDITISSEGSSASGIDYLYIIKEEAPKAILDFVAKSSVGDISYTGQVTEGEEVTETYIFPRYINVDGTLYETSSSDGKGDYRKTFTFNADNLNQVVEYTATDIKPVFFSEGEDLAGASVAGGIPSRTSMTKMGYGTMNVTSLPAGKYEITVNVSNGNSSERKVAFVNGENELAALTFAARVNGQIKTTEEIILAEETAISVIAEGSSAAGIDYLYIVKTGEYVAPAPATYTLTVQSNNTAYGAATANVYEGITEGQEVTLSAVPAEDCYFINWTVNGNEVSKEQTITVNVVSDSTFVANFGKNVRYDIAVVSADENMGAVSGSATGVLAGDPVSMSAYPNEGYEFDCWMLNGGVVSEDAVYTTTATANATYTARFRAIITYNVTVSSTEGGSASGSGKFAMGSFVTVVAEVTDDAYKFVGWFSGDDLMSEDEAYSFDIYEDVNLTAKFKKNVLTEDMTITISQIGYNTITPDRNIDLAGTAVKGFYASSASDNTVTLTRVYELVAGEAYLLAGEPSKEYGVTATTFDFPAPAVNYFVPVTEDVVIGEKSGANTNCYLTTDKNGKNAGFYVVEGTQTISAGKAYLSAPLSNAELSSFINIVFEEEDPTSAEAIAVSAADAEGWYTIGGVKVNKPAKGGLYVHGGKAVIVK